MDSDKPKKIIFKPNPLLAFFSGSFLVVGLFWLTLKEAQIDSSNDFLEESSIASLCFYQIIISIFLFGFTAFSLSRVVSKKTLSFFNLNKKPLFKNVLFAILLVFLVTFFLTFFIDINQKLVLPDYLSNLIESMKNKNVLIQEFLLGFDGFLEFMLVFLAMALVPAVVEEVFFRGLLQGSLLKYGINYHHAILISSILFAVVHAQLYEFLAFLFMGMVLGYLYYFTKNIWISILAHLFNNGLIIILVATNKMKVTNVDLDSNPPILISIIAIFLFILVGYFFILFNKRERIKAK